LRRGTGLAKEGDFTFCPICDFNELDVAERAILQLLRYLPDDNLAA
jgi:hypothetical protein